MTRHNKIRQIKISYMKFYCYGNNILVYEKKGQHASTKEAGTRPVWPVRSNVPLYHPSPNFLCTNTTSST